MTAVNLKPLLQDERYHNHVDTLLVNIARKDDRIETLDPRDFLEGIPTDQVERFLLAADRYISARSNPTTDVDDVVDRFLKETKDIPLPSEYRAEGLPRMQENPYRVSDVLRGRLTGYFLMGGSFADNTIQKQEVDWRLLRRGLSLEGLWPVSASPVADRFPYLYMGLLTAVTVSNGSMKRDGETLGDVDAMSVSLVLQAAVLYPVRTWLGVKGLVGYGFEIGRFDTTLNDRGNEVFRDPCEVEGMSIIEDPNEATKAVECGLKTTVGAYRSFPVIVTAGARLFNLVNLDVTWTHQRVKRPKDLFAPRTMDSVLARLGVDIY